MMKTISIAVPSDTISVEMTERQAWKIAAILGMIDINDSDLGSQEVYNAFTENLKEISSEVDYTVEALDWDDSAMDVQSLKFL